MKKYSIETRSNYKGLNAITIRDGARSVTLALEDGRFEKVENFLRGVK